MYSLNAFFTDESSPDFRQVRKALSQDLAPSAFGFQIPKETNEEVSHEPEVRFQDLSG